MKAWEIQANQFSAELLTPALLMKTRLLKLNDPELAHIEQLSAEFATSVEMTARRVVELSEYACAVVFSKENVVRYSVRSPFLTQWQCVKKGERLPNKSLSRGAT